MDDQDVSPLVGVMALGVILAGLAAVAWLLVDASQTTGGGHGQVRMSVRQVLGPPSTHHRLLHPMRTCLDAAAPGGRAGCVASSAASSASPSAADRRARRAARQAAVKETAAPTLVPAPPAPVSPPPSTSPVSTSQPSTPPQPAPTRRPPSHHGPVPGGSTSPPHLGPRP